MHFIKKVTKLLLYLTSSSFNSIFSSSGLVAVVCIELPVLPSLSLLIFLQMKNAATEDARARMTTDTMTTGTIGSVSCSGSNFSLK